MAEKKTTPPPANTPDAPARQQMTAAGVAAQHHDEALALKAPMEARGLNWGKFITVLSKAAENAPALLALLKELLKDD